MTDHRDLVERLRHPMMTLGSILPDGSIARGSIMTGTAIAIMDEQTARRDMLEAADEIEQLRAKNKILENQHGLKEII